MLNFLPQIALSFLAKNYLEGSKPCCSHQALVCSANASTLFARILAGSITLSFFTYAFVNMGMVSGILPVVGVPLPFISYGGTAMVTLGLALGMLLSVSKSRRLIQS